MGRHKFRLSDMIPNAWFFKLRDMRARGGAASPRGVAQASAVVSRSGRACGVPSTARHGAWLPHRASHYYTPRAGDLVGSPLHPKASDTHFPPLPLSPPRRSRRRHRRRSVKLAPSVSSSSGFVSSPVSTGCRCGRRPEMVVVEAPDTPPCRRDRFVGYSDEDNDDLKKPTVAIRADDKLEGKVITSATEIIIDLRTKKRPDKVLPPIVTKPARKELHGSELEDKHIDVLTHAARRTAPVPEQNKLKPRRSVSSARRLKTRANTPRVASKKCNPPMTTARSPALTKPPLAESFAVVKSSRDPRRDFRESMEEMIAENGIRTAADLEDLLACYLSLNAKEYHDLIVEVFEHIWATLSDIKM
ncbi:transcription repressor OFP2-like [Phragmites australis]|uniref:transcription repressor OFP2-like n=1 Tax=Phragmites australis TaxID=29695 RepID=UPI002D7820C2|nr:transcription repressor OFP2-like [Phragmites australis]